MRRLLRLTRASGRRLALVVALGTGTVACGIGLMATAGYLISRAAEQPAVLSLTVAIVCVRFFGLTRPLLRYLERLSGHDLALRVLARVRVRVYRRLEPLAPGQLGAYRDGDLLSRMVADVDALQGLHLRGVVPPLVAVAAGTVAVVAAALIVPWAGVALAAGLIVAGVAVPLLVAGLGRRAAERRSAAAGMLTAELVELLRAAPELVAYGRQDDRLARLRAADRELVGIDSRGALAGGAGDGLRMLVTGATVSAVLAIAVAARAAGGLDPVLVAAVALLALAAFEAVQPLTQSARELPATLAAGRRVLEIIEREPVVVDPGVPAAAPGPAAAVELRGVCARYGSDGPLVLEGLDLRLAPGARVALTGPAAPGRRPWPGCCCASSIPATASCSWTGATCGSTASTMSGQRSRWPARRRTCSRPASARTCCWPGRGRTTTSSRTRCGGRRSWTGCAVCRTASTLPWARRGASCRAGSASGSWSPGRCWRRRRCWCSTSPQLT